MICKCSSSAAGRRTESDRMASMKRIAVAAAVVLLLSMAVVGAASADGETYKVTYDGNGDDVTGTVPEDTREYSYGDIVTVMGNTEGLINNTNKLFAGWNTKADGTGDKYLGEEGATSFAMPATDVTLYAQWATGYTEIAYIQGDGKSYIDTGVCVGNSNIKTEIKYESIDDNTSTYVFGVGGDDSYGYYYASSTIWDNYGDDYGVGIPNNEIAVWVVTKTGRDTQIYRNGAFYKSFSPATRPSEYTDSYNRSIYVFYKNGGSRGKGHFRLYYFSIWEDGNTLTMHLIPCVRDNDGVVGMYDTVGGNFIGNAGTGSFNGGYKLTYDANGGTGTVPVTQYGKNGDAITVSGKTDSLVNNGYDFNGWVISDDGSGIVYGPEDGQTHAYTITADTKMYANWEYTVTYDENGATAGSAPGKVTSYINNTVQIATQGDLTKTGSVFTGWNTQEDGSGTAYQPGTAYTGGTVTLYAQWASPSFTFTIPASVPLSQDTTQQVTGTDCTVSISSNESVTGKMLRVKVNSDATADLSTEGNPKTIFSLSGTGGDATYKVGKWTDNKAGDYIEGNEPSVAYGNEVVKLDISTGTAETLKASQQLFFETESYDGAGSYSGVLNFAFEVTTKVTGITISGYGGLLAKGCITQLTANVLPTDASDKTVTWSSSNTGVATVDANGIVTGVNDGTVTIKATANDGSDVSGTYIVTVGMLPNGYTELEYIEGTGSQWIDTVVTGVAKSEYIIAFTDVTTRGLMGYSTSAYNYWGVNGGKFEVERRDYEYTSCELNKQYDIIFEASTENVTLKVNEYSTLTMNHSSALTNSLCLLSLHGTLGMSAKLYSCVITQGSDVVRNFVPCINEEGVIGMYDTEYSTFYKNAGGGVFYPGPVITGTTDAKPVTGITISGTTSVAVGSTTQLTALCEPTDATYKYVTWSSSDATKATVNGSGKVTGVAATEEGHPVTITATAIDGKGAKATCTVMVTS